MASEVTFPNVQLTVEQVRSRLASRVPPGVTVVDRSAFFIDFTVRRSAGVGVGVKVVPGPAGTTVKLYGYAPSFWLRMVKGFVLAIFLSRKWRAMEAEVAGLLKQPDTTAPRGPVVAGTPVRQTPAPTRPAVTLQPRPAAPSAPAQPARPSAPAQPGQRRP